MTIGEKIKLARSLKGITQKELGFLVNLQDVRIRQYETNARTPKHNQLQAIADALGVSMEFFSQSAIDTSIELMHTLFDIEQVRGISIQQVGDDRGNLTKYAIVFDDSDLNGHLGKWFKKDKIVSEALSSAKDSATKESIEKEYALWKAQYPQSMLDEMADKLKSARSASPSQSSIDE